MMFLLFREQRQKDSVKIAANSFPRDMDYRQEALQDKATASKSTQAPHLGDQVEVMPSARDRFLFKHFTTVRFI